MTLRELYDNVGGSYEDALSRLMSDSLIDRFIRKYPQDKSYTQLIEAAAENDKELAFRAAHTLKGVAGNLGFSELAAAASELTEQLRPQTEGPDTELVTRITETHNRVIKGLERYCS